ncbi:MAG: hypothetical protein DHS20C05_06860 [Hyphococcus sp.]|nr:MAG: hypothetical protein DHS20C05_06860 [Marinicaulis sp.]
MSKDQDKSLKAALDALKKARHSGDDAKTSSDNKYTHAKKNAARSPLSNLAGGSLLLKVYAVFDTIWSDWARPVTRFLNPITKHIWRFYGWSYNTFAHVKDENKERVFSRNRAAFVTIFLAALTITAPIILVRTVIPTLSQTVYDAGMLATMKEDRLFLSRADLINPDRQLYQVMGCRDISGCDGGDNTTYYRLRDNVILDIKYWTTRFEPYDPAEIAGAMVSELNDCTIKYYGRRSKALGWYPYIISANCVPV